jgi:hypothetical protein
MVGCGRKQPWPILEQRLATEQERALVGVLLLQQTSSCDTAALAALESGRSMLKLQAPAVGRRKQQVGGASVSVLSYTPPVGPQGIRKTPSLPCNPRLSPSSCEPFFFLPPSFISYPLPSPSLLNLYPPRLLFLFLLLPFTTFFFSSSTSYSGILPLLPPFTSPYIYIYIYIYI